MCLWEAVLRAHEELCGDQGASRRNVMVVVWCNGHVEECPSVIDRVRSECGDLENCEIFLLPLYIVDGDMNTALMVRC